MTNRSPARAGVLLYDKPSGVTSHDVVAEVRRELGNGLKVGHSGTLDPFATGLLLILIGRATRVQRFLMALPKTYEVTARFGATSSTGDPEGEILETGVVPHEDLRLPTGRIRQRPPAFSAVKIGGRRAYELARAGERVETAEREIEVYRFEEVQRDEDRRRFVIECSSGTYVRSLISDLGDAYCESLRRARSVSEFCTPVGSSDQTASTLRSPDGKSSLRPRHSRKIWKAHIAAGRHLSRLMRRGVCRTATSIRCKGS